MLKYKLPAADKDAEMPSVSVDSGYRRRICVPVSQEMADALEVGKEVEFQLQGKVTELRVEKSGKKSVVAEVVLDVGMVMLDAMNQIEALDKAADSDDD